MPFFRAKQSYTPPSKSLSFNWERFDGGLNTFFKDTEIAKSDLAQATNLMLTGRGIPTKRWGTGLYFEAGAGGSVRGLGGFYQVDGTNELLAITDDGYLNKQNGSSYTEIAGVSWASGYDITMAQISDKMYFVGGSRELSRYDGTTLTGFPTIGQPVGTFATQISGASGTNTLSYRLTHTTTVGETAGAVSYQVANQPKSLTNGTVRVEWTNASTASGILKGTNIYRGTPGNETFITNLDGEATEFDDDGSAITSQFAFTPTSDTTGGINAKYIRRFQDRLVYAGIDGDPTLVVITGAEPLHESTDFASNGGLVRVEPDSGDDIVGLEIKGDKIIVFKQRSVWQIALNQRVYKEVLGVTLTALDPQVELITASVGCASHKTIQHVENDILFLASDGRGIFVLGNEPGILGDILRTNEISVKVRPYFEAITNAQEINATSVYYNNKYFVGFPGKNETMVFDRERNAWMGPWTFDARVFHVYYNSSGDSVLLKGDDDDSNVYEISGSFKDDAGTAFDTILRTKREDFDRSFEYKNVRDIYTLWRNLTGSVSADVRLEQRGGNTVTAKSFTVATTAGNSGWGAQQWADTQWADSEEQGNAQDLSEVVRRARLNKGARNVQMIVKTSGANDNYELMQIRGDANQLGTVRPLAWKV